MHHVVFGINFQIHSVSLTTLVSIHLLIHFSTHLCQSSPLSSSITPSLFHSRLKTYLFNKSFHLRLLLPIEMPSGFMVMGLEHWTGPITLMILFLVSHFSFFLFILCGRLSWLPVSFLLHVKYTLSYRIVKMLFKAHFKYVPYESACDTV